MELLSTIASFVFVLGVIIFVHEGGHYLVAKLFDVRVLTFSLGFGKRIWGFQRGETEYRVSWVPLGGYVRLGGEGPGEATGDPRDFQAKPRWQRILVYLAGPAMNVVLAIVLIAVVFMAGIDVPYLQDIPTVVGAVEAGAPADEAGLRPGDVVVEIKGKTAGNWQDVAMAIVESPEMEIPVVVDREGERIELYLTPAKAPKYEFGDAGLYPRILPRVGGVRAGSPAAAAGFEVGDEIRGVDGRAIASPVDFIRHIESHPDQKVVVEVLRAGSPVEVAVTPRDDGGVARIGVDLTIAQRFGPLAAVRESVRYNWNVATQTFALVGKLLTREVKAQSALHGPIEIAALSGEAARRGPTSLLHLMGLVSISIGILNLLPIPILDGGQIVVLLVESAMRRDLSLRLKEAVSMVGLALVMLLMIAVIFFDLRRNVSFGGDPAEAAPPSAPQEETDPPGDPSPVSTP